ncbi:ADP-ribose diphosphatase [Shewanella yunxiaonensis]|uniref:ADP-ribose pyrophosphatase n=1 Tax=Shewanella yunxiaonensis TaxID=2829809 RepID=A0ABX7YTA6_9GAMM|nr:MULTISPECIES: ADP-ribose diphosphatase [Shewanella]MDF0534087.1 ADP-ribose diphosphatase [Shewanella sp. A32]QUN05406.1 ADP-ribose diphosphatase [Shewanella yunxiaonensis]
MKPEKFSKNDIEILGKRTLYSGFFSMEEYRFRHRLFAGGWSGEVRREIFERGHAVVVLPYDPVLDQVVLIEQLRFPAVMTSDSPWLLELVAGMIDSDETPEQVARRELMEESGLTARSLHAISSYLSSPGGSTERFYFYWAAVDASVAGGIHGLAAEHEDIRVVVLPRQQAYEMTTDGRIDNVSTALGLQWLQLNYQQLMARDAESKR